MTKYYCDCCGDIITQDNDCFGGKVSSSRLGTEVKGKGDAVLRVEIITALNGIYNDGHFCRFCVLDALNTLDTRKKEKSKATLTKIR